VVVDMTLVGAVGSVAAPIVKEALNHLALRTRVRVRSLKPA
jgi:hypothetical protein